MPCFLRSLVVGCAAVALAATSGLAAVPKRPNVVFILADDLCWRDTSLYGSTFYETPNIDRLAKRGMMFTNAYSASPLCSPSRSAIMTGLWLARTGITRPSARPANRCKAYRRSLAPSSIQEAARAAADRSAC